MGYRKVDPQIWNDEKFRNLSDDGQLVFLFVLTHPQMTSVGAMRATLPGLAAEKKWELERFRKAFEEGFQKGMILMDEEASFIVFPNFLYYNGPENPNVVKAWAKALKKLPECDLKTQLIEHIKEFLKGYSEPFQTAFHEELDKLFNKAFHKAFAKPFHPLTGVLVRRVLKSGPLIQRPNFWPKKKPNPPGISRKIKSSSMGATERPRVHINPSSTYTTKSCRNSRRCASGTRPRRDISGPGGRKTSRGSRLNGGSRTSSSSG